MLFLQALVLFNVICVSVFSLLQDPAPLQRRLPQDDGEEDEGGQDDSARTTTIKGKPGVGRTTTIRAPPTTLTRRTTVTVVKASPTPAPKPGGGKGPNSQCPQEWFQISKELDVMFVAANACTKDAHAAIRAIFHDCFPQGGCDGSLTTKEEMARPGHGPMAGTLDKLKALAQKYRVTNADMLAFAGSHAVVSCPGGPVIKTYIGRKDANRAAPEGQMPPHFALAADSVAAFRARGFTTQELAALMGAHTVSRQFDVNVQRRGASQDTTPDVWDATYYVQTLLGTAPFTFESDMNLGRQEDVGPWMSQFATDKSTWDRVFSQAMTKMEFLGTPGQSAMVECTDALPKGKTAPQLAKRLTSVEQEQLRNLNFTLPAR